jgi:ADP-ribose pyrophosphatase
MADSRITVQSSSRVFQGRVFSTMVDRVQLPHGAIVDMEVVRHAASVVLIPLDAKQQVVLVRQYRYAVDRWIWELPAGSVDAGESPQAAARRECAEEVGLRPGLVEQLGTFYPTPGFCDEAMIFFRLADLNPLGPHDPDVHLDPDEHFEIRRFSLDDLRTLIRRGEIQDMKTVVGVWLISEGLRLTVDSRAPV